jgi:hypothetical protein
VDQYERAAVAGLRFVPKDRFDADVLRDAVSAGDESAGDGR